jgi:RNA polymerase sigma factor (sigma-70 family)
MKNIKNNTAELSDQELIGKILEGNCALFEVLVRRYNPLLYRIARSYGFNHQDAEDLMQDTHVTAYMHLQQLDYSLLYKPWLTKILIHKCLYKQNHGYSKMEAPDSELVERSQKPLHASLISGDAERIIMNRELSTIIESNLNNLPPNYRTVLILREVEGFSVNETAELMDITASNVKVRLNRAKALLQKKLKDIYESELFSFNLIYCDAIVQKVFIEIGVESDVLEKSI